MLVALGVTLVLTTIVAGVSIVAATGGNGGNGALSSTGSRSGLSTSEPSTTLSPDELNQAWDKTIAAGRIGVMDSNGKYRGTIDARLVTGALDFSQFPKGVAPVLDSSGAIVGYDGPRVGFIERDIVEAPGFDIVDYIAGEDPSLSPDQLNQIRKALGNG
jgi:hypothetical protein